MHGGSDRGRDARDVVEDPSGGGKRPAKRATAGDDDPLFQTLGRR